MATTSIKDKKPQTVTQAFQDTTWHIAMSSKFNALLHNGTWDLVAPTQHQNAIGCKWMFKIKCNSNGTISIYKARLVAKGFNHKLGIDFTYTLSPVIKPATIQLVLSIALSHNWLI